jgi:hypothetical protein
VVLLHALVAVIHAVLQSAAEALLAGFSLLLVILITLAILAALIASLAGGLGFSGLRWLCRRKGPHDDDPPADKTRQP